MIKKLLALAAIGMMAGCAQPTVKAKTTKYTISKQYGEASKPLKIAVIEGCEYFVCSNSRGDVLTHKGNCKNPIHKGGNK